MENYSTTIEVNATPEQVFAAINNPSAWWPGNFEGNSNELGSEFIYTYKDMHTSTQKVAELIPNTKVVWDVMEANMTFIENKDEWKGTKIVFEITEKGDTTQINFTHIGLVPMQECYKMCVPAWDSIIKTGLKNYIETGKSDLAAL